MSEDTGGRISRLIDRISAAAERSGRKAADITLVAVSKTVDPATVQRAVDFGLKHLGENRVQDAASKAREVTGKNLHWHLIGPLQSNKARLALETFDVIHTIDRVDLVSRLDRIAGEIGRKPDVLIQVKMGDEATKSGAAESDIDSIVEALDAAGNLSFTGLMCIPPLADIGESARPYFRRLGELARRLNQNRAPEKKLSGLSMGMSGDFEVAIEEGATMVRVGTAIFGARPRA